MRKKENKEILRKENLLAYAIMIMTAPNWIYFLPALIVCPSCTIFTAISFKMNKSSKSRNVKKIIEAYGECEKKGGAVAEWLCPSVYLYAFQISKSINEDL